MPYDAPETRLAGWDRIFSSRPWGRYPPEELVRFMARRFAGQRDKSGLKVLEVGCGPGANLWYLAREGYAVAAIDGSPAAIEQARERLLAEDLLRPGNAPDLRVGDFAVLPWNSETFDAVIDIEALYANPMATIREALGEVRRVLKPGGAFFAKMFGAETTGAESGEALEPGTRQNPTEGPCAGTPLAHYFTRAELEELLAGFSEAGLDWVKRSEANGGTLVFEWLVSARK
jgi:SAM-dependent methyltransferase